MAGSDGRAVFRGVAACGAAAIVLTAAACGGADARNAGGRDGDPGVARADTALRRLVADLLPEMERRSGLPLRRPVRLGVRSREELEAYLTRELGRQLPADRVEGMVRVYARLGLVPDSLRLEPLLRALYLEQVVGYYDPAADTLFVVEGVASQQLEAVLAHEIVHALQDQYMDIDSVLQALEEDNDRGTAARAALEGHATYAMLEWQLAQVTGRDADLRDFPALQEILADNPLAAAGVDMPVLEKAPAVIRESLLFPYLGGLAFVQGAWRLEGTKTPPLADRLPESTEQVLHPERYVSADRDAPEAVRFLGPPPAGWSEVATDDLGEFEIRLFLREHTGRPEEAKEAAAGWDGDRYRLLDGPGGEALVWVSLWDTESDAEDFAARARQALAARYAASGGEDAAGRRTRVELRNADGRSAVLLLDAPAGPGVGALDEAARFRVESPE
ncbi:MAG: hypothetical protein ACE5HF_07975 [Gemmatimonadota bacterium]